MFLYFFLLVVLTHHGMWCVPCLLGDRGGGVDCSRDCMYRGRRCLVTAASSAAKRFVGGRIGPGCVLIGDVGRQRVIQYSTSVTLVCAGGRTRAHFCTRGWRGGLTRTRFEEYWAEAGRGGCGGGVSNRPPKRRNRVVFVAALCGSLRHSPGGWV